MAVLGLFCRKLPAHIKFLLISWKTLTVILANKPIKMQYYYLPPSRYLSILDVTYIVRAGVEISPLAKECGDTHNNEKLLGC